MRVEEYNTGFVIYSARGVRLFQADRQDYTIKLYTSKRALDLETTRAISFALKRLNNKFSISE